MRSLLRPLGLLILAYCVACAETPGISLDGHVADGLNGSVADGDDAASSGNDLVPDVNDSVTDLAEGILGSDIDGLMIDGSNEDVAVADYAVIQTDSGGDGSDSVTAVDVLPEADTCISTCGNRTCGPDGCGSICGYCSDGKNCIEGQCVAERGCPDGFVLVPSGTFIMGSPEGEYGRGPDELQIEVTLPDDFCAKTTEVTVGEWTSLMENDPSYFGRVCGSDCPMERVTWWDAIAYCNALSTREGREACYEGDGCSGTPGMTDAQDAFYCFSVRRIDGCDGYRLPTEEEWEYFARAGSVAATYSGIVANPTAECSEPPDEELSTTAWYCANSKADYLRVFGGGNGPHPVGALLQNAFGIWDVLGNVGEWCENIYDDRLGGFTLPSMRVSRGGTFRSSVGFVRLAKRFKMGDSNRSSDLGFRVVRGAD